MVKEHILSGENTNAEIKSAEPEKNDTEGTAGDANSGQVTVRTGTVDQVKEFKMVLGAYRYKTVVAKSSNGTPIVIKDEDGKETELRVSVVAGKVDVAVSASKVATAMFSQFLSFLVKMLNRAAFTSAAPGALEIPVVGDLLSVFVEDIPGALLQHSISDGMNMFIDVCFHDVSRDISKATYSLDDERLANIKIDGFQLIKVIAYFAFSGRNDVIKLFSSSYQFVGKFIGYVLKDALLGAMKRFIDRIPQGVAVNKVLRAVFSAIRELVSKGIGAALVALKDVAGSIIEMAKSLLKLINDFFESIKRRIESWKEGIEGLLNKSKEVAVQARRESDLQAESEGGDFDKIAKRQTELLDVKAKGLLKNDVEGYGESVDKLYKEGEGKQKELMKESNKWKDDIESKFVTFGEEEPESEVKNAILSPLVELIATTLFRPGKYADVHEIFPDIIKIGDEGEGVQVKEVSEVAETETTAVAATMGKIIMSL